MQLFFLICLFLFGLIFWSFSSVIIHRLKSWEWWICAGRSHCGSCNKILETVDLIPLVSWCINKWSCRRCKASVSCVYPFLELCTGILFAWVWYFLIDLPLLLNANIQEIITLLFWLTISFISIIYIFYDILFLEIHEKVLATWVWIWVLWIIVQAFIWIEIFTSLPNIETTKLVAIVWIWTLLLTIWWLYTIILKELDDKWDVSILVGLYTLIFITGFILPESIARASVSWIAASIWALAIFTFFYLQILLSWGKWMWQWDLRIAIMVWIILGTTLSFPAMMLCYLNGSIIWLSFIGYQKITKKGPWELNSQIPFGPFIAIGFFIAVFFQEEIHTFMNNFVYL